MKTKDALHGEILNIALPSILTNVTVPVLGIVDMAIVGHLGAASYIGAIAIGSNIFNMIYWIFAFLRMGTTGIMSQAYGRDDRTESVCILWRSLLMSVGIALLVLVFQVPLRNLALAIMAPGAEVRALASLYIDICIWGAPAVLALYSLTGWLLGSQNARYPLYIAVIQNLVNIAMSLLFVLVFGMDVAGVALGTLVAQYAGLLVAVVCCIRIFRRRALVPQFRAHLVFRKEQLLRFFHVNRDIFLRTLCVVAVTVYFTSAGSRQGDIILAANALLMQFFTLYSFFMDGFAYAGEALSGKISGGGQTQLMRPLVTALFRWGVAVSLLFTLFYLTAGTMVIGWLTDAPEVARCAAGYLTWTYFIPLLAVSAFTWDGVFIGLTATRQMLLSMAGATAAFFLVYLSLRGTWHNHALWCAFLTYLFLRGAIQHILYRKSVYHNIIQPS